MKNIGIFAFSGPYDSSDASPSPPQALDEEHRYFHILGIDMLLNDHCKPIVVDMNDSLTLSATSDIERPLKMELIADALKLITTDGTPPSDTADPGGWEKIFPDQNTRFGVKAEEILNSTCIGWGMSPRMMAVKRLGYVPSASQLQRCSRRFAAPPRL
jgi:hypothetical protein